MGIDISDKLMVGVDAPELDSWFNRMEDETDLDKCELIEQYFDYMSPYYDSDPSHWFIGFTVPNYQGPDQDWFDVVQETAHQFEILTGVKARLKGGAHVY